MKDEYPLGHEIGEDDAERDGRVVERRAVGVSDGFEKQALHIRPSREELLEQLPRGAGVIVVIVHLAQVCEEGLDGLGGKFELLDQDTRKVCTIEGRADVEVRIDKTDVLELMNAVGNFLRPVTTRRLNHPMREAMQGNVKDVAAGALEEGGQAAELVMVLEQEHLAAEFREVVRSGHPAQAGTNDDGVIAREEIVERRRHCGNRVK